MSYDDLPKAQDDVIYVREKPTYFKMNIEMIICDPENAYTIDYLENLICTTAVGIKLGEARAFKLIRKVDTRKLTDEEKVEHNIFEGLMNYDPKKVKRERKID